MSFRDNYTIEQFSKDIVHDLDAYYKRKGVYESIILHNCHDFSVLNALRDNLENRIKDGKDLESKIQGKPVRPVIFTSPQKLEIRDENHYPVDVGYFMEKKGLTSA